jgi:RHS repeat-associated protein
MSDNTTYYYRVQACNSSCSGWSAVVSVAVLYTPGVPSGPTGPSTSTTGAYTISWGNAAYTESHYEIEEQINGGGFAPLLPNPTSTSKAFSGKANGTYGYRVRACNIFSCSGWSGVNTVTVSIPPSIQGPSNNSSGNFTLTWTSGHRLALADGDGELQFGTATSTSYAFTDVPSGVYTFRLNHCYQQWIPDDGPGYFVTQCNPVANTEKTVTVTRTIEPIINHSTSVAGTTAYSATVSGRGGSVISVRFEVIPGVNGFQPTLSLSYDSARATDIADIHTIEDPLGYGWRLNGLSRIHHCRVGLSGSNKIRLDGSDRLCLDGELLKVVSGTYGTMNSEYRTETQSFIKVVHRGTWFEVFYPDGKVAQFGNTSDSRASFGPIYQWGLNSISDPVGGQPLTVTYKQFSGYGMLHPQRITYSGAEVEFYYGPRADLTALPIGTPGIAPTPPPSYIKQHVVLHTVKMRMNGLSVREYRLDSNTDSGGRVRLEHIQECGFDESGSNLACYKPLTIGWTTVPGSTSQYPIAVSQITDGLGAQTHYSYSSVTTASNPLDYSEAPFGGIQAAGGIARQNVAVVNQMQMSDGLGSGGLKSWSYKYKNFAYKNTLNRGYVGFYENRKRDNQGEAFLYTQMRMDFPFFGAVSRLVETANEFGYFGPEMSRMETKYVVKNQSGGVVFPYVEQQNQWSYDGASRVLAAQTATQLCFRQLSSSDICPGSGAEGEFVTQSIVTVYKGTSISDASGPSFWGDVKPRSVQGVEQTVVNTDKYQNTNSPWVVGAGTKQTTTHSVPGKPSRTVSSSTDYKPGTLIPAITTLLPGNTELESTVTSTFTGNLITAVMVDGVDAAPRENTFSNYVASRYPTIITNAEGHTTEINYDLRFGVPKTVEDPNEYATSIQYDAFGRTTQVQAHDGTLATIAYERCGVVSCPPEIATTAVTKITRTTTHTGTQVAPTQITYTDRLGRMVLGEVEAFSSADGWQRQLTAYDVYGRVQSQTLPYFSTQAVPSCPTSCIAYGYDSDDAGGKRVHIAYPDGHSVTRIRRIQPTTGRVTIDEETNRDPNGNGAGDAKLRRTLAYNTLGQLLYIHENTVQYPTIAQQSVLDYDYDAHGNLIEIQIEDQVVASMNYDLVGNRTSLNDINTGFSSYNYDGLGQLLETADAKNQITRFDYDLLGRVEYRGENCDPSTCLVENSYTYDPANAIGALASRAKGSQFLETYNYRPQDGKLGSIQTNINVPGVFSTPVNSPYTTAFEYDAQGRPQTTTYPNNFTTTQEYNSRGYGHRLNSGGQMLSEINQVNHFGGATQVALGNGLYSRFSYDPNSGRLTTIKTGQTLASQQIQDLEYQWRSNGSLYKRTDRKNTATSSDDVTDTFTYDGWERLKSQATTGAAARTLAFDFDKLGNLLNKVTSVGAVSQDNQATNYNYADTARPHRLTSVNIKGITSQLNYDANGNIERYDAASGDDAFIDYDGQNRVARISVGSSSTTPNPTARDEFWYGPDGERVLGRESWNDNGTQRSTLTTYLGNVEEVRPSSGTSNYALIQKTNLGAAVHIRTVDVLSQVDERIEYIHTDHQGSIDAITNQSGALVSKTSFDAFGGRRESTWSSALLNLSGILVQENEHYARGYTAHEHLNRTGFIHMNGRVYDPRIGRFISADPFVQAPTNSQSYNRYSYVFNSPVSFTDPSGYFSWRSIFSWESFFKTSMVITAGSINPLAGIILSIGYGKSTTGSGGRSETRSSNSGASSVPYTSSNAFGFSITPDLNYYDSVSADSVTPVQMMKLAEGPFLAVTAADLGLDLPDAATENFQIDRTNESNPINLFRQIDEGIGGLYDDVVKNNPVEFAAWMSYAMDVYLGDSLTLDKAVKDFAPFARQFAKDQLNALYLDLGNSIGKGYGWSVTADGLEGFGDKLKGFKSVPFYGASIAAQVYDGYGTIRAGEALGNHSEEILRLIGSGPQVFQFKDATPILPTCSPGNPFRSC